MTTPTLTDPFAGLTPHELERANRRVSRRLVGLRKFASTDAYRAPAAFVAGLAFPAWRALTDDERLSRIERVIRQEIATEYRQERETSSVPAPHSGATSLQESTPAPVGRTAPTPVPGQRWIDATDRVRRTDPQHYAACIVGCGRLIAARPDRPSVRQCGVMDTAHAAHGKRRRHSTPRVARPTPAL